MKRLVLATVAFVGVALSPGAQAPVAPDAQAIAEHVRQALARDRVPGAAVAVIWRGEVVLLQGFGTDGVGRPVTPHTGFRLGSMSKAFTALAVMRAVEANQLSLDAPVQSVLPDFALTDPQAAARITLRQLMAHTSGLPRTAPRTAPRAAPEAPLADHVAALAKAEPAAEPGERHIYSSPNYLVAARMLEVATGTPFADVLSDTVFGPLGLSDTLVTAADDRGGRFAPGHRYLFGFPLVASLPEEPGRLATAGVISTAADMARFLRFQLGDGAWEDGRLLGPALMAEMQRGTTEGDGFRYAMGWRESRIGAFRALHHGGILPDFRGKMVLLPELGNAVVVLTNASTLMPLPAAPTSHRLADEIARNLVGEPLRSSTFGFGTAVLAVWSGLVLLLAAQLRALVRPRPRKRWPWVRAVCDLGAALALTLLPPLAFGLSWQDLWLGAPDLVIWSALMIALVGAQCVRGARRTVALQEAEQKSVSR
ncbi:MAG: serine hydrolase domain-containing protein [Tabrizicola sp.]